MVTRVGGSRRKTRYKMSRSMRQKGKLSITAFMQEFAIGDAVTLVADSVYQGGMYDRRSHGKSGQIVGKQGECYQVAIMDGRVTKIQIVHPVHLRKSGEKS